MGINAWRIVCQEVSQGEPGDGITHTMHRSVCIWKARGQGAEKQGVVNLPVGKGVGERNCGLFFL